MIKRLRELLPELVALPLMPVLILQGRHTRRHVPRLPEPTDDPWGQIAGGPGEPMKLLVIGESPVAGIGVTSYQQSLAAMMAGSLGRRSGRAVEWSAWGRNGATVADAIRDLLPLLPAQAVDIACVAFGVNDCTAFRRGHEWHSDMIRMLELIEQRINPRHIVLSGVPPLADFPALPWPLRAVLGLKASALDSALARIAASRPDTSHAPLPSALADAALMAPDGYHPSAAGCEVWAEILVQACRRPDFVAGIALDQGQQ
ncbi:SGNH/GDSL hydrolase family protein [Lacisediminimonas profundi]|uniref:SGNH/GDSL hydrolase family protein n=1 Tax=Lacisediminimonas profundi TaxID=2603856 RepID=UPI001F4F90BF|nr:SGNH/GDSL hydrolase family protein [Lacisediminimonas profundi]